ncbi:hypothetical protein SLS60_011051 [Paraconiothyrium brasiliense]|uniref:J domain-containing protein n=1 Tax=Paraconiothyrium brasiliense TaxID=300254 RepID=A0ABR3QKH0_9PLEO
MSFELLPDHYKTLGLTQEADASTIRRTYRKLALKCHPDRFIDEALKAEKQEEFSRVQLAYETLGDEDLRARYHKELKLQQLRQEKLANLASATSTDQQSSTRSTVRVNGNGGGVRYDPYRSPLSKPSPAPHKTSKTTRSNDREYHEFKFRREFEGKTMPFNRPVRATSYDHTKVPRPTTNPSHTRNRSRSPPEVPQTRPHRPGLRNVSERETNRRYPIPKGLKGVPGNINQHKVLALGDTGAQQNCVREQCAIELGLHVRYLDAADRPSFVLGQGSTMQAVGVAECTWVFAKDRVPVKVDVFIVREIIFDIILGWDFLYDTDTLSTRSYRLCAMPRPRDGLKGRLVNLCGTPVRCMRGNLGAVECSALPDYGAEPNLISYDFAEKKDWLLDMYQGPESCRLLQFADGSTTKVSGRLRLQWNYLTGWGPVDVDTNYTYYEFDVLRGCPFDVILGCDILDETDPFNNHLDSLHELVRDAPSGLNVVLWVKARAKKQSTNAAQNLAAEKEREQKKLDRNARMQRLAEADSQTSSTSTPSQLRSPSPLSTSSSTSSKSLSGTSSMSRKPSPLLSNGLSPGLEPYPVPNRGSRPRPQTAEPRWRETQRRYDKNGIEIV